MALKRKKVNSEVRSDINLYFTPEVRETIKLRVRQAVMSIVGTFELVEDPKVQNWAHRMVPQIKKFPFAGHVDRLDVKTSIRKFMRRETMETLGYQQLFPELFLDNVKLVDLPCPKCKSIRAIILDNGKYKCHNCNEEYEKK